MHFVFLSAHKVRGLIKHLNTPDISLFEGVTPRTEVFITRALDPSWAVLDQQRALSSLMPKGLVGGIRNREDFLKQLEAQIDKIREHRAQALGEEAILLIKIQGDLDIQIPDHRQTIDNLVLCFDAYDKQKLKADLDKHVCAILAGLRIGGDGAYELERISDGSYLIAPDGKVVHSFSIILGTPTAYISKPINAEQVNKIRHYIAVISKETGLANVIRLFVHSLDRNIDKYRAFISAWSAMEITVNKIFSKYESDLIAELSKISAAPGLKQYLSRISDVMKGKYSLVDKFAVISIFLDGQQEFEDITKFKNIKKIRDNIFHGQNVPEEDLPIRDIQSLFEKYFCNHVDSTS